jgi:hypothetical protein
MANWLADPVACATRLRKEEGGCIILAGRNEVLSRSTRVYRTVEQEGTARERTVWASGNVKVTRVGQDQRRDHGKANLRLTITQPQGAGTGSQTSPPLLAAEAVLAADVLRAAAVNAGGSACGGQTILELLWQEMMVVYERLMTGQAAEHDVGIAQGIAYSIAIMQNPYRPSIDDVREQASQRWEEDQ